MLNGNRNVPYLNRWNDKRKLNLNYYDNRWNDNCRFLLVGKSLCNETPVLLLLDGRFICGLFSPSAKHPTCFIKGC